LNAISESERGSWCRCNNVEVVDDVTDGAAIIFIVFGVNGHVLLNEQVYARERWSTGFGDEAAGSRE
jgi:hypothetical protein